MEIGEWKPVKKWVLENGNEGKGQVQYTRQDVGLIRSKDGNGRTSSSIHDGLDLRQKDRAIDHPNILLLFTRIKNTGGGVLQELL